MSEYTPADLESQLEDLFKGQPKKREFVFHTGIEGAKLFNEATKAEVLRIRKESAKKTLNRLIQKGKVLLSGKSTFIKMIESADIETFELAETLLKIKNK